MTALIIPHIQVANQTFKPASATGIRGMRMFMPIFYCSRNLISKAAIALLCLLMVNICYGDTLDFKYTITSYSLGEGEIKYNILLLVKNIGDKNCIIPTSGWAELGQQTHSCIQMDLVFRINKAMNNEYAILSPQKFQFIELRPGEQTLIEASRIESRPYDYKSIRLRYVVEDFFSKRYGCWSGDVVPVYFAYEKLRKP